MINGVETPFIALYLKLIIKMACCLSLLRISLGKKIKCMEKTLNRLQMANRNVSYGQSLLKDIGYNYI